MPTLNGTFSGKIASQSATTVLDQPGHNLSLGEVVGTQTSSDPLWNNAALRYWGINDLVNGQGTQRGYYVNTHADGDRDWGTFEGNVTSAEGTVIAEGTYQVNGGSGKLSGIRSSGVFRTRMTAAGEVEGTHQGTYELAAAKAQAG